MEKEPFNKIEHEKEQRISNSFLALAALRACYFNHDITGASAIDAYRSLYPDTHFTDEAILGDE